MSRPAFVLVNNAAMSTAVADPAQHQWFRYNVPMIGGWANTVLQDGPPRIKFDSVLSWHPCVLAYFDVMSIRIPGPVRQTYEFYSDVPSDAQYILTDAAGGQVKLNYGDFSQFAADVSNPAYQDTAIAKMKALLTVQVNLDPGPQPVITRPAFNGLMLDDVNLNPNLANAANQPIACPVDVGLWRTCILGFMKRVREAFPNVILMHNTPWRDIVSEQFPLCNYLNIEGGFSWITSQADTIQFDGLMRNPKRPKVVVSEKLKANLPNALGCYDELQQPGDLIAVDDMLPNDWGV